MLLGAANVAGEGGTTIGCDAAGCSALDSCPGTGAMVTGCWGENVGMKVIAAGWGKPTE